MLLASKLETGWMLLIARVINHRQLSSARDGFSITWTLKSPLGIFLLSVPWLGQK